MSGQRVVGAAGIVAGTLTGVWSQEHAAGIDHLKGQRLVVLGLQNQMFRGIAVGECYSLLCVVNQYQAAVIEGLTGKVQSGQGLQLLFQLVAHRR